jgi:hypothetical protein
MIRTGTLVVLLGVAIAVLGTLQYNYVLTYTQEPLDASQVLMWISWGIGGALLVGGGVEVVSGAMHLKKPK